MLSPLGQIRMSEPTAEAVKEAVCLMMNDSFAHEKTEEIRNLLLPSWDDIGPEMEASISGSKQRTSLEFPKAA